LGVSRRYPQAEFPLYGNCCGLASSPWRIFYKKFRWLRTFFLQDVQQALAAEKPFMARPQVTQTGNPVRKLRLGNNNQLRHRTTCPAAIPTIPRAGVPVKGRPIGRRPTFGTCPGDSPGARPQTEISRSDPKRGGQARGWTTHCYEIYHPDVLNNASNGDGGAKYYEDSYPGSFTSFSRNHFWAGKRTGLGVSWLTVRGTRLE